jgi:hypothetical protein
MIREKKVQITGRVSATNYAKLTAFADTQDRSQGWIIDLALSEFFEKYGTVQGKREFLERYVQAPQAEMEFPETPAT